MAYLEISKGKALLQSPLDKEAMSIGRLPGNTIVINDPDISRRHCVIEREGAAYTIYDLGSRNGTLVNGERVQRVELKAGDVITLGGTIARFLDMPPRKQTAKAAEAAVASDARATNPPLRTPSPVIAHRKNWLIWFPAVTIFLLAAFIVAWAMGLLGGRFTVADLRQRLGLSPIAQVTTAPSSVVVASTEPSKVVANDTAQRPPAASKAASEVADQAPSAPALEADTAASRYRIVTRETDEPTLERLLGQHISARFVGKPLLDERNQLIWELPPDGVIVAVFETTTAGAAEALRIIEAEPKLIEADLSGRLVRDSTTGRLILRVGVIEVLHAWADRDNALQPATLQLLNKRVIVNPGAQASANADEAGN